MKKTSTISFLIAVLLLSNCTRQPVTSTARPEGNIVGKICDENGSPVSDASVLLVPEGYSPLDHATGSTGIDSTRSDASGYFAFDVASSGKFNLLANNDSRYALRKSIPVNAGGAMDLPQEVLHDPGALSGTVQLSSMDDHHSALVLLTGTNTYASCDASGVFSIGALAEGSYELRVLSMESDFAVVETTVTIVSGEETTLPPVTLFRKRVPQIDAFTVDYDPLMMEAVLSWKTGDTDIIDSFRVYCNRERNITPVFITGGNDTTLTIDCIAMPLDTFTYQIAPVGSDGWEAPAITGKPFVNKSIVTPEEMGALEYATADPVDDTRYHFTPDAIYRFMNTKASEGCKIIKYSINFAFEKEIEYPENIMNYTFHIASDSTGNLYVISEPVDVATGTMSLVKFNSDLEVVNRYEFQRGMGAVFFSFAVSSVGAVALFKSAALPKRNKGPYPDDSTVVTVLSPDFSVLSEKVYTDLRAVIQSVATGDSVAVVVECNDWEHVRLVYFDADFTMTGSADPLGKMDFSAPVGYTPVEMLLICSDNLFLAGYEQYAVDPKILYFFNSANEVVARYPYTDYIDETRLLLLGERGFYSDGKGYVYHIKRDNERFAIAPLIDAINR